MRMDNSLMGEAGIDRNSPLPMYYQLKGLLLRQIRDKALAPGDALPSEMELIDAYEVSRTTVRQAIAELVKDGVIYTIKGKGTFVAKPKIDLRYMNKSESFASQIERSGFKPSTQVVKMELLDAGAEEADALGLELGDKVIRLARLRYADDDPIVYAVSFHPFPLCAFLFEHDLSKQSLYGTLALRKATKVARVKRTVEAIAADKSLSQMLKLKKGFPIQHFHTIAYSEADVAVEYCISDYRGDRNTFSVEIFV